MGNAILVDFRLIRRLSDLAKEQGKTKKELMAILRPFDERSGGQVLIKSKRHIYVRLDALKLINDEKRLDDVEGRVSKLEHSVEDLVARR